MNIETGGLTGAQVLKALYREAFSAELPRPIRVRGWGETGVKGPYTVIVREEILRDFLQRGLRLKPHEIDRIQLHILGERPHKIPKEERDHVFPPDERKKRKKPHYAWITTDKRTGTHTLTVAVFRMWAGFERDRRLFVEWSKRKKRYKADPNWEALRRKTKLIEASAERRAAIEGLTPRQLELFLNNLFSQVGSQYLVEFGPFHEGDHSKRYRDKYDLSLGKRKEKVTGDPMELDAEKAEERFSQLGEWNNIISFIVNEKKSGRIS